MRRTILVAVGVLAIWTAPAEADTGATTLLDAPGDTATIIVTNDSPAALRPGGLAVRNPIECTFEDRGPVTPAPLPGGSEGPADPGDLTQGGSWPITDTAGQAVGRRVWRTCRDTTTGAIVSQGWVDVLNAVSGAVVADAVRQEAVRRLSPPAAAVRVQPSEQLIVRFETWLSIEPDSWRSVESSVSVSPILNPDGSLAVPGVRATARAAPSRVLWHMGDGATVPCDGPGTLYQAGIAEDTPHCGHTYLQDSDGRTLSITAEVHYTVAWNWSATDGTSGGGNLPVDLIRRSTVFRPVVEVQAVNVEPEGGS